MLKITIFAGFLGVSLILPGFAANPPVAEYGDWRMFVSSSGQSKNCYIAGEQKRSTPKAARRGDIFLTSIALAKVCAMKQCIGYPFSATSEPFARVGSDEYGFFTAQVENGADEWAWLETLDDQNRLVSHEAWQ